MIARARAERRYVRKVRAPQGRVLGNTQWGRPQGKCHRNADRRPGLVPGLARVER